jgi:twitching motility protein PilT
MDPVKPQPPVATVPAALPVPTAPAPGSAPATVLTPQLIAAMVKSAERISDLIFSPGRAPQVEVSGQLVQLKIAGVGVLTPDDTARIAADLIGRNDHAVNKLRTEGSCDISYSLPKLSRFRVNVFTQRGSCAIVMRVIALNLPEQLAEAANLAPGIVLVTGPTGSGKSSTLAALVNKINEEKACHIITIEDPIEFLHSHKRSTVHQRELHSDAPNFAIALRAALRQAPKLILVGEMRDRETIEVALEAAETGHLVYSTLHTIDASKTVERIVGTFPLSDQNAVRMRLSKSFRFIISQRLIPRADANGRVAAFEVLKATLRTREYVQKGEGEGKTLLDAMRDGSTEGMQCFDDEIEKLIRAGVVDVNTGLSYATNAGNMRLLLADLLEQPSDLGSLISSSRPKPTPKQEPAIQADPELEITR